MDSWIERLHKTSRCRDDVMQCAAFFSSLSEAQYGDLIQCLVDTGEDQALGILLNVCAVNKIKLNPDLLARTLKVVEPVIDFAHPFIMQDQTAIEPVLAMALAEDISSERQAFAARLAAELVVRYDLDRAPVKKVLLKISNTSFGYEARLLNTETLALLELEKIPDNVPWLTRTYALKALPKEKPPVIIGGSYSVRRPVPKLGRNEPCHCGSGKKYKKCCIEKDQALIRDASPYEGLTMTELRSRPGLVDDPELIENMRAYELKKLIPETLGSHQLLAAYRRSAAFGLRNLAFEMLVELEGRSDFEFDPGHFQDLLDAAFDTHDLELAQKIKVHIPDDQLMDPDETELHLEILENPAWLAKLEERCRKTLAHESDEWNDPLFRTSCIFEKAFPALSIVFARAAIVGDPDAMFEHETLLDIIHRARTELDLDPWEDPTEDYLDWLLTKQEYDSRKDFQNKEIEDLKEKVAEAKHLAAQRLGELKKKEQELDDISETVHQKEAALSHTSRVTEANTESLQSDKHTIAKLRRRIDDLKLDISSGQQARRDLLKKIQAVRVKVVDSKKSTDQTEDPDDTQAISFEEVPKKILFPEFTDNYQRSCKTLPGPIVIKSLKAASGFAAHDRLIWRQTKSLEGLSSIYSIRIGIHHRLLIRWEREVCLEVLDMIQREQLNTWIKQNGSKYA